jgi:hypothetical protein
MIMAILSAGVEPKDADALKSHWYQATILLDVSPRRPWQCPRTDVPLPAGADAAETKLYLTTDFVGLSIELADGKRFALSPRFQDDHQGSRR